MTNEKLRRVAAENDNPPILPEGFQPAMQSVLAVVADIDFAHEREMEKVNNSGLDDVFKSRLISKLDQRHRERRQPYAQELVRLQKRIRALFSREPV